MTDSPGVKKASGSSSVCFDSLIRNMTGLKRAEINRFAAGSGFAPIHSAATACSSAFLRRLIACGGNVHLLTTSGALIGSTPLHLAAAQCRADLLRVLLHAGARTETRDAFGETALYNAIETNVVGAKKDEIECIAVLLDAGADVNAKNLHGCTPLNAAVISKKEYLVRYLLTRGANPNDADGVILAKSIDMSNEAVVLALLEHPDTVVQSKHICAALATGNRPIGALLVAAADAKLPLGACCSTCGDLRAWVPVAELAAAKRKVSAARQAFLERRAARTLPLPAPCAHCKSAAVFACSVCRTTFYCTVQCQKQDWHCHRRLCTPLKQ